MAGRRDGCSGEDPVAAAKLGRDVQGLLGVGEPQPNVLYLLDNGG